jgi:hypothetical protein
VDAVAINAAVNGDTAVLVMITVVPTVKVASAITAFLLLLLLLLPHLHPTMEQEVLNDVVTVGQQRTPAVEIDATPTTIVLMANNVTKIWLIALEDQPDLVILLIHLLHLNLLKDLEAFHQ